MFRTNETKRILLAEENNALAACLKYQLEAAGMEAAIAPDNSRVVSEVNQYQPDLIVLQDELAGQDGFEICQQLKNDRQLSAIPVIIFSQSHNVSKVIKAYKAGASHYVAKTEESCRVLMPLIEQVLSRAA